MPLLLAWCWVLSAPAFALRPGIPLSQYRHRAWGIDEGLPQSSVLAMAQTGDGFIWLGTEEGLVRWNGAAFHVEDTRRHPALVSDHVTTLAASPDDTLWIGTPRGLAHRTDQGYAFLEFEAAPPRFEVTALAADSDGSVWVGTRTLGLARYNEAGFRSWRARDSDLPADEITALHLATDGVLWVGTRSGLARIPPGAHRPQVFPEHRGQHVTAIGTGPEGRIWLGLLVEGRAVLQPWGGDPQEALPPGRITAIGSDGDGNLWFGSKGGGLSRLSQDSLASMDTSEGLTDAYVLSLLVDREGNLLVGTREGGLNQLSDASFFTFGRPEGLPADRVGPILHDHRGHTWIGTRGGGVVRLSPSGSRTWSAQDGLPGNYVLSLYEPRPGVIWVTGAQGGMVRIRQDRVEPLSESLAALQKGRLGAFAPDGAGGVWIGDFDHRLLHLLADGTLEIPSQNAGAPELGMVLTLERRRAGGVWIGTDRGLGRLDASGWTFPLPADPLLSLVRVQSLYEDEEGVLWVGTSGDGILRIQGDDVRVYSVKDGLHDQSAFTILDDRRGNLWFTSNRGIYRVRKTGLDPARQPQGAMLQVDAFDTGDGLRSPECNGSFHPTSSVDDHDRLWFPTNEGAVMYDPNLEEVSRPRPPLAVAGWSTGRDRGVFSPDAVLSLPRDFEHLRIRFQAPYFYDPANLEIETRLESTDADWKTEYDELGSQRHVTYERLPPATYTLEAQARVGGRKAETAVVTFEVRSEWWYPLLEKARDLAWIGFLVLLVLFLFNRPSRRRNAALEFEVEEWTRRYRELKERYGNQLRRDELTEVGNERLFGERLEAEWRRACRDQASLSVILLDLDDFETYNNLHGFHQGNRCLQQVARSLQGCIHREGDLLCRRSGDTFGVILPDTPLQGARYVAETMRSVIADLDLAPEGAEKSASITASVGVASEIPRPGLPWERVVHRAQRALTLASEGGGNRVEFVDPLP